MKFVPTALAGAVAIAFAQVALAQVNVQTPKLPQTGDVTVEQRGVQNSQQIGEGNQSTQVYGNDNQTTTQSGQQNQSTTQGDNSQANTQSGSGNTAGNTVQSGEQNQSAVGSGNQQSQQSGTNNQSSQAGRDASNEQNRQYSRRDRDRNASSGGSRYDDDDDRRRGNKGWHKGWENNKHRDESSGKYDGRSSRD